MVDRRPTLSDPAIVDPATLAADRSIATLIDRLEHHEATSDEQLAVAATMIDFARSHDDALVRSCVPGHFTGSALVVEQGTDRFCVLHHTKLDKWLQPGGHTDGEANLAATALREATEETGIVGLTVVEPAIDLDIHEVRPPAEPAHLHLDLRFVVIAPRGSIFAGNHESRELRWVTIDDLADLGADEGLYRLARNGLELAGRLR